MPTKKPVAGTAAEMLEKYKRKPYTGRNAGLCIILNYIYRTMRGMEPEEVSDSLPENLYTSERIDAIVYKAWNSDQKSDVELVTGIQALMEWIATARDSAWAARMSAKMAISSATTQVRTLTFIAKELRDANTPYSALIDFHKPDGTEFLQDLSGQGEEVWDGYDTSREHIINSLCFLNAYNVLMDVIEKELDIPEFSVFKIQTEPAELLLRRFSEMLKDYEAATEKVKYLQIDTSPIEAIPKPVPEENIKAARMCVRSALRGSEAWSTAFTRILANYWRRIIVNG